MGDAALITIDEAFRSLIPPLSDLERLQLEENILQEGCRDPLVVWNDGRSCILVDGHNRHDICERNGLDFAVVELAFRNRNEAVDWICRNQLGRRNLSPADASELRGRMYNGRKKKHGGERKTSPQNEDLKTAEVVAKETGVSKATIERDGKYAEAVEKVAAVVPEVRQKVRSGEVTRAEVIEAAKAPEKAAETLAKPHVTNNSGNNEWYTPAPIVEAARSVMGSIDLDPASCTTANEVIKATAFYDATTDGLAHEWHGNVWLNPPYGQPLIAQFAEKALSQIEAGNVSQMCVLCNNATDTVWCQSLLKRADVVCFVAGRVKFLDATLKPANTPLQGQIVVYFGNRTELFRNGFAAFGECLS